MVSKIVFRNTGGFFKENIEFQVFSKSLKVTERKVFGLDKNQVLVVVIVLLVSLILYSVLLLLTVKAAQCQDTLETIMKQRRDWQKKIMEGVDRRKGANQ